MAMARVLVVVATLAVLVSHTSAANPLEKVVQMLGDLQAKVVKEGEVEQATYEEYQDWCEDESKTKMFEIKTGKGVVGDLNAHIEKASADIDALDSHIQEATAAIATHEQDLKSATEIRNKEHADWESADKELDETIDTLDRAVSILQKTLGSGSSFIQSLKGDDMTNVVDALTAVISATGVEASGRDKLQALVQEAQGEEGPSGSPAAAVYESKSGAIVDLLEDMQDKAEQQKSESMKAETNAKHNFDMLRQSLEQQISHRKKELVEAKKDKAATEEHKAAAEGDLAVETKSLQEDEESLKELHADCMQKAVAFETSQKERAEELNALQQAKSIIEEMTGGAGGRVYKLAQTGTAFVQTSSHSKAQAKSDRVMDLLHKLARSTHDSRLDVLALRLGGVVRSQALLQTNEDPFVKVKGLINEMITKLESEAAKEASHKEYCDKEMSKTVAQREELSSTIDDLTTKLDKNSARIAQLKNEVATLQAELASLAKSQQEMDKMRSEQHEEFVVAEKDLKDGVEGVRLALKVLREYYASNDGVEEALLQTAHNKAAGAGGGIIAMLEVIESDFSKNLADAQVTEEQAREEYESTTKENALIKVTKSQDAKYKAKEQKSLEAANTELTQDRDGTQTELDAVLEYYDRLVPQCTAKPESYAERKARRESEIAGLKNALEILEGEAVGFLQIRH